MQQKNWLVGDTGSYSPGTENLFYSIFRLFFLLSSKRHLMPQFLSLWLLHLFLAIFSWNSSLPGPTSYILFHLCSPSVAVLESSDPIGLAGPLVVVWPLCEEMGVSTGGLNLRAASCSRLKGAAQGLVATLDLWGHGQSDVWWPLLLHLPIARASGVLQKF